MDNDSVSDDGATSTSDDLAPTTPPRTRGRSRRFGRRVLRRVVTDVLGEPGATPVAPDEAPPPEDLLDLLRRTGTAMSEAGDATNRINDDLFAIAQAYDAHNVRFFVLPTGVFVRIGSGANARVDFAPNTTRSMRLDQIGALYSLIGAAKAGRIEPTEGVREIDRIETMAPWVPAFWSAMAHGLLTLGLGLTLNPVAAALPWFLVLGIGVGFLRVVADRYSILRTALPVLAAMLTTWAVTEYLAPAIGDDPLRLITPALISFLPGAALTMATVELTTGQTMAGSARLVDGLTQLLLLSFGVAAGISLATPYSPPAVLPDQIGSWAPWLGVLVFGIGQFYFNVAPRRALPWMLLVLFGAYAAQLFGAVAFDPLLSGFVGALVVVPLAYWIEDRTSGPPALVTFMPAFWLLVPGALGFIGLAEIASNDATGLTTFTEALQAIVSIALGVLVGSSLTQQVQAFRARVLRPD